MNRDDLERLAGLIRVKNDAGAAIADLIRRPCASDNIGEFSAARVFAITLMTRHAPPITDSRRHQV